MGRNGGVHVIEVGVAGKKDAQEVPRLKALLRPRLKALLRPHTLVAAEGHIERARKMAGGA